jgi:hypothetical protein
MTATYAQLFRHVEKSIQTKTSAEPYQLVKEFIAEHSIDEAALIRTLQELGGYDDHEVLLNVQGRVPSRTVIGTPVETPAEYAARHSLNCRKVDGRWKECRADDPEAEPDLNRASVLMGKR